MTAAVRVETNRTPARERAAVDDERVADAHWDERHRGHGADVGRWRVSSAVEESRPPPVPCSRSFTVSSDRCRSERKSPP